MSKPVPRSRLNLKYRTQIDGHKVEEKLPFRLLVLGNFSNGSPEKLESRQVQSAHLGSKLDSFMKELDVTIPIENAALATTFNGALSGSIAGEIKRDLADRRVLIKITGAGEVSGTLSDNGLGDVGGRVTLAGQVEAMVEGDNVHLGSLALRATGTVDGEVTGDIAADVVCHPSAATVPFDAIRTEVTAVVPIELTIPVRNMASFGPEHVARQVPEIRRLFVLKRLLADLRSKISDYSDFRDQLKTLLKRPDLADLQAWFNEGYEQLAILPERRSPVEILPPATAGDPTGVIDVSPAETTPVADGGNES